LPVFGGNEIFGKEQIWGQLPQGPRGYVLILNIIPVSFTYS